MPSAGLCEPLHPSPGLVYRGQVLLAVVSHVHLGYTRCLCRGLGRTGQGTASPLQPNLCRGYGSKATGHGRVGTSSSASRGATRTDANSVSPQRNHYQTD